MVVCASPLLERIQELLLLHWCGSPSNVPTRYLGSAVRCNCGPWPGKVGGGASSGQSFILNTVWGTIMNIAYIKPKNSLSILKERKGNEMIITWLENQIYEEKLKKMGKDEQKVEQTPAPRLVLVSISSPSLGRTSGCPENPLEYLKESPSTLLPTSVLYVLPLVSSSLSPPFLHAWFISPNGSLQLIVSLSCCFLAVYPFHKNHLPLHLVVN